MASRAIRLRLHLLGPNLEEKNYLAKQLRKRLNARIGRTLVVPDLRLDTARRMDNRLNDHVYYLALENDYLHYETGLGVKTKHIVFVDSIIDRFIRIQDAKLSLDVYFQGQLRAMRNLQGQLFVYGPNFDTRRSRILSQYDLPVQMWDGGDQGLDAIVEAAALRIHRSSHDRQHA